MRYYLVAILHGLIMLLAYTSPLWLDWRLIIVALILYWLQIIVLGGCVLTKAQFGTYEDAFTLHYASKIATRLGGRINRQKFKFVLDYIIPPAYILISIIIQLVFHYQPLIKM